jgi:aldehyde dehydrogenase (NAD+)
MLTSSDYAGWADKIGGEMFPEDGDGMYKLIRYEPIGVCAGIAAWNGTQVFVYWKIAPAVAAGNTVSCFLFLRTEADSTQFIFKTSEKSPLGALALGKLVVKAGFPPGVINFVSGAGKTGQLLSQHMQISKISFTGSAMVGRKIQEASSKSNLKRVTLELGGKSASLVFNDADLENAVVQYVFMSSFHCCCLSAAAFTLPAYLLLTSFRASQGFLLNSGQVCAAASRLFVQDGIAPKFLEALKARFEGISAGATGNPLDASTFLGPVADKIQYDRVMKFIEQGKKDAKVVTGGGRHGDRGNFIEPTIFLDPPTDSKIYTDEIFGPVLVFKTFRSEEEGIELANDTSYGLAAYLYTSDVTRALRISAELEAGSVFVNTPFAITTNTPFGGFKESGNGSRESGKAGLMSYLEAKTVLIK